MSGAGMLFDQFKGTNMNFRKTVLALSVLGAVGMSGCGGSSHKHPVFTELEGVVSDDANKGGGGGGAGGNGGVAVVIYETKTWTGSYTLTGGSGGALGNGVGTGGNGTAGNAGAAGVSYEILYGALL